MTRRLRWSGILINAVCGEKQFESIAPIVCICIAPAIQSKIVTISAFMVEQQIILSTVCFLESKHACLVHVHGVSVVNLEPELGVDRKNGQHGGARLTAGDRF